MNAQRAARLTAVRTRLARSLPRAVLACAFAATPGIAAAARVITDEDIAAFERRHAPVAELAASPGDAGDAASGCALLTVGPEQSASAACQSCHIQPWTHPVDVIYLHAAEREPARFIPAEEVVRAGGLLPDGQVRCVTCHDRRSPWKFRLALPPGAVPLPSVAFMQKNIARFPELRVRGPPPMPRGSDVTPTPLCRLCHRY